MQWLRVGAVAVGLGAAIATGQAVAIAAPADSPNTASAISDSSTDTASDSAPSKKGSGAAAGSASSTNDQPTSKVTAQQNTGGDQRRSSKAASVHADAPSDGDTTEPDLSDPSTGNAVTAGEATTGALTEPDGAPAYVATDVAEVSDPSPGSAGTAHDNARSSAMADPSAATPTKMSSVARTAATMGSAAAPPPAPPATPNPTPVTSAPLTPVQPPAPTKVTFAGIVADVLDWVGLGSLASDLQVPAIPVGPLIESLWLVVRDVHYRQLGGPAVVQSAVATGPTLQPDPVDLSELLARPGVTVSLNADGSVDVIDGAFTDTVVVTTADAARVVNELAPTLGAAAGFADPGSITVRTIGGSTPDDIVETFYRVNETVDGIAVVGSDVILVTDGAGNVTGLFNNHDPRVDGMDLTLDESIDQRYEAATFPVSSTIEPQLVVYSPDAGTAPRLVWRVVVDPPQSPLGPLTPGTTYYLYANGSDAATVMAATANAQALSPGTAMAADVLGRPRTINIASDTVFFFFQVDEMLDTVRNISTSQTTFGFFGLFGPSIPSTPLSKGWFGGWDSSAVSAHANVADVYDYYQVVLGLTSFDGAGAPVKVAVGYNPSSPWFAAGYDNAFWDYENQQLVFGDGAVLEGALDVVGHEYTHAVISYAVSGGASALESGESGAVNEAYADILGSLIEGKTGAGRWLIGEDSQYPGGALRNLANPTSISTSYGPYRDNYATRYTGTEDDSGEHINSTIFSHAAYLMMTDPATADISQDTWARVFYHSMYRLSATATFIDARAAVVDTADEFAFTPTQLNAIEQAFDDVGIAAPVVLTIV